MLFLVNDILDYAQLESKSIIINKELTNVLEILKDCVSIFDFQASTKNIELQLEHDLDFPPSLVTDPNRFRQIIINLLSNAIKYT